MGQQHRRAHLAPCSGTRGAHVGASVAGLQLEALGEKPPPACRVVGAAAGLGPVSWGTVVGATLSASHSPTALLLCPFCP